MRFTLSCRCTTPAVQLNVVPSLALITGGRGGDGWGTVAGCVGDCGGGAVVDTLPPGVAVAFRASHTPSRMRRHSAKRVSRRAVLQPPPTKLCCAAAAAPPTSAPRQVSSSEKPQVGGVAAAPPPAASQEALIVKGEDRPAARTTVAQSLTAARVTALVDCRSTSKSSRVATKLQRAAEGAVCWAERGTPCASKSSRLALAVELAAPPLVRRREPARGIGGGKSPSPAPIREPGPNGVAGVCRVFAMLSTFQNFASPLAVR